MRRSKLFDSIGFQDDLLENQELIASVIHALLRSIFEQPAGDDLLKKMVADLPVPGTAGSGRTGGPGTGMEVDAGGATGTVDRCVGDGRCRRLGCLGRVHRLCEVGGTIGNFDLYVSKAPPCRSSRPPQSTSRHLPPHTHTHSHVSATPHAPPVAASPASSTSSVPSSPSTSTAPPPTTSTPTSPSCAPPRFDRATTPPSSSRTWGRWRAWPPPRRVPSGSRSGW